MVVGRYQPYSRERDNFTLIELLVVIAIIAILVAMLLPAITQAKKFAMASQCLNNQHQVALALIQYSSDFQGWIPGNNVYGSLQDGYNTRPWSIMIAYLKCGLRHATPDAGNYIQNPMVLYCPSQNPPEVYDWYWIPTNVNTIWQTYGIVSSTLGGSWMGCPWNDWTKVISGGGYYDRWINLGRCPKPDSMAMIADTVQNTAGTDSKQSSFFDPVNSPYQHIQVHARHNGSSNFTFFDGHSGLVKEGSFPDIGVKYYCKENYIEVTLP